MIMTRWGPRRSRTHRGPQSRILRAPDGKPSGLLLRIMIVTAPGSQQPRNPARPTSAAGPAAAAGSAAAPGPAAAAQRSTDLAAQLGLVARGDGTAFDAVFEQIGPAVFGVVRRVIRDPAQSEEVTQEVMLEVWRNASKFDAGRGSATAWVMTLAHRRAVDRVRSVQKESERERRTASADIPYDEVLEAVESSLERERVRRCLNSLTEVQRESVTLAYYRGYTYGQVASLLGVPTGTVKTRMRDALIRLRDCLGVG
jgi:RNA polymerase sigma-70 factor, ECF subfamily